MLSRGAALGGAQVRSCLEELGGAARGRRGLECSRVPVGGGSALVRVRWWRRRCLEVRRAAAVVGGRWGNGKRAVSRNVPKPATAQRRHNVLLYWSTGASLGDAKERRDTTFTTCAMPPNLPVAAVCIVPLPQDRENMEKAGRRPVAGKRGNGCSNLCVAACRWRRARPTVRQCARSGGGVCAGVAVSRWQVGENGGKRRAREGGGRERR